MIASMDTGAFDSGASTVSAGYRKMLNGAKQANAEAARAVRDYQKQIDKYMNSPGANLPALKQMEGKLARLQLDQKQAQATVAQTQLEERLFQATHTHEEVLIRDMQERLAVQRELYAGNEKIQSLLTKTYNAEAAQVMAGGGEGGGGKLFGHGLTGRKIVHAGKYAAGAMMGSEGGEIGAAIGMGLMVGGVAGVALGGAMMIASAYHEAKARADRLVDSQIRYNKELRESKAWWDKLVDRQNTASGSQHAARALELEEKAQDIRDEQEAQVKKRGWLERFGEWGARKYIGLMGEEDTHETTGDADARTARTRALELENEAAEHRQEAERGVKLSIAREAENNRDKITAARIGTFAPGYDRSRDEILLQNASVARASKQRHEDRMHDLDKGNAPHERKVEEQQRRDAEVEAEKKIAALKMEGFENEQKRQDRAGYLENRAKSMVQYDRGFKAQIGLLHEQRDNELDMFEGTEEGKKNIQDKYRLEEKALTRQHNDELAAIDSSTRATVIETNERGLAMELDLLKESYTEKVRLAKGNADDIAAITRKNEADKAKAKEMDARQERDYLRNASYAAKEAGATTAAEKEKIREQQIHDDAIAAGKTEGQARARVAAQHKIFEAEQDQAGRAAHLALHPYESYLKHKAELDAKVGHGGYTKADEARELTREWRAMQGPAGQFFNSGESRWKAIQTELLNPQDTAAETLQVTNQMAKDIRALLTGGLKLVG
jgi:hypothetical protein